MKNVLLAALLVLPLSLAAFADDHSGNQTKCPIMGGEIDKTVYTDYKDMRIFFCCPPCSGEFMKDPETHIAKMKADGVELMKLQPQSVCPVSGAELKSKDHFADVEGKRVYTCCPNCIASVKENPEKYMKVIAERGEYLEEAPEK